MQNKRSGRFGPFLGCSGYPECKTIVKMDKENNPKYPDPKAAPKAATKKTATKKAPTKKAATAKAKTED